MHKLDVFTLFSLPTPSMFLTGQPKVQCLHSGILLSSPQALGVWRWREMQPLIFPSLDELIWCYSLDVKGVGRCWKKPDLNSMFLYVCFCVCAETFISVFPHHELDGKAVAMGSLSTERTEFGFRLKPAASPSSVVCPSWRIWCVKSGITSCPVELRFGCLQDSWHLQRLWEFN